MKKKWIILMVLPFVIMCHFGNVYIKKSYDLAYGTVNDCGNYLFQEEYQSYWLAMGVDEFVYDAYTGNTNITAGQFEFYKKVKTTRNNPMVPPKDLSFTLYYFPLNNKKIWSLLIWWEYRIDGTTECYIRYGRSDKIFVMSFDENGQFASTKNTFEGYEMDELLPDQELKEMINYSYEELANLITSKRDEADELVKGVAKLATEDL